VKKRVGMVLTNRLNDLRAMLRRQIELIWREERGIRTTAVTPVRRGSKVKLQGDVRRLVGLSKLWTTQP
jgi:hypothetical protein